MRIVAGKFRRRKLLTSPGLVTRPLTDRVKESLFERLTGLYEGHRVADVFAGTGTIGLEALSRGAKSVVFIERDRRAFEFLEKNIAQLGVADQVVCWKADVTKTSYRPKGVEGFYPYDLVFFDPPFRMVAEIKPGTMLFKSLERLARPTVSSQVCRLVLRTPEHATFDMPTDWELERTMNFSTMDVSVFRKPESPDSQSAGESLSLTLKEHMTPAAVPVFDCHVIVTPPDDSGGYRARAANLEGIFAEGPTEREALQDLVRAFKARVAEHMSDQSAVPWKVPPERPVPGEIERWLPVHL